MDLYDIKLVGTQPLLMHHDNIEWADAMEEWKNDPVNKRVSKAGDDRSPSWRWIGSLYHDGKHIALPAENLMRCLMEAGAMVPVPGGRSGKTFKAQTQSGMMCRQPFLDFRTVSGVQPRMEDILRLRTVPAFVAHRQAAEELGFRLNVKRARIGQAKHIRVRPEFDTGWSATCQLAVWDAQLTEDVLRTIIEFAGIYKGLGDWRPGGRTPGQYGTFAAELRPAKK